MRGFPGAGGLGMPGDCQLQIREKVTMTDFGTEPTFRAYLQILRQRKWWVGSITVLGLALTLAFSLTAHKQYSATAQLLVQSSLNPTRLATPHPPPPHPPPPPPFPLATTSP